MELQKWQFPPKNPKQPQSATGLSNRQSHPDLGHRMSQCSAGRDKQTKHSPLTFICASHTPLHTSSYVKTTLSKQVGHQTTSRIYTIQLVMCILT